MSGWAGVVRGWGGCGAEIQRTLLPMHPTQTVPMLVWPGAARARGQCWYTTDIAPLLRTQTVPRLGSGYPFGWGGAGPVLGYNGHCSLAPHANSPRLGSGFAAWLVYPGRRGASAGIQRTLLPCMHPTQTVPRLVWPCSARARGWGGDTTDIAPLPPTQTVHRLIWPCSARARGWGGNATYFAPLLPTQTVPGWEVVLPPLGLRRGRGASAGIQRTLLPCSARKQSPGIWPGAEPVLGYNGHCSLAPYANSPRLGGGFAANSPPAGLAGAARGWGCGAGIQRTLLPCSLRKQSPARRWFGRCWRRGGAARAGASAGIQRTFAPHAPYANSPHAGLAWCGAGAGLGREYNGHLLPMLPTQTVPRLGSGFAAWLVIRGGAGPVLGYNGHCSPCTLRKQSPGWFGRGAGLGRVRSGDTTDIAPYAPYAPYANSPPADLAECGAGAGLGRECNVLCSLTPYANSLPAGRWFCRHVWLGRGGAARARGQCWDTADIAPLLRTQTVSRLIWPGAARRCWDATAFAPLLPTQTVPGWEVVLPPCLVGPGWCGAGAGPVLGYNGHCSHAPYANSPPAGKWFSAWLV